MSWADSTLGDLIELQRGHDLPSQYRKPGPVPIIGSFGVTGTHSEAKYEGPGVAIGRSGASIGKATYVNEPYWPLNTCLFVRAFKENDPRWVYRLLDSTDFTFFNSGSAQPSLNRNFLKNIPVKVPPLAEQQAIAEVLEALDDKISTNSRLAATSMELAGLIYEHATSVIDSCPMSELLNPVLGGTPSRSREDFWAHDHLWASAKDVTGAHFGVIVDTDEKISDSAVLSTKAKPLPAGSVILTARGTVGAVARLAVPSSFNQSCYGFVPGTIPPGLLYFAILRATERAKAIAHGSVFDTITMKTFNYLSMPNFADDDGMRIEAKVQPLLDSVTAAVKENRALASTRDALLPLLMSGKLRVKDTEKIVEDSI